MLKVHCEQNGNCASLLPCTSKIPSSLLQGASTPTCDQTGFLGNYSLTSILDRTSWREAREYSEPSVAPEEIADGIWNIYFGPLKLGRLLEEHLRIEDAIGRVKRPL